MAKINQPAEGYIEWWCPGCEMAHIIPHTDLRDGLQWHWNHDTVRPTVAPSVLRHSHKRHEQPDSPRCHCFITDGKLMFMADSTHALSGHTVEIPEWLP